MTIYQCPRGFLTCHWGLNPMTEDDHLSDHANDYVFSVPENLNLGPNIQKDTVPLESTLIKEPLLSYYSSL